MARSYRQFCALARTMDVVGERWTLLVVRELLLGPRRYGELLSALQGMGTNLLAARLEALQEQGVIQRRGRDYALTERGRALEDAVLALARWGMAGITGPTTDDRLRADWYAVAMLAAHGPAESPLAESYEFDIDGEVFHLVTGPGRPRARRGPADDPTFRLRADLGTFLAILTKRLPLAAASRSGDETAARRWLAAFALPAPS